MGDPKSKKKKYSKPTHPWQKERIEEEKALITEFGLKNKGELWRVDSLLRRYTSIAKRLIALDTPQSKIEKEQLLKKLSSLGVLSKTAKVEDTLALTPKDFLNRRLQTIVHKKNLAKSIRQARQFITHRHINIKDRNITVPSYLVSEVEEPTITINSLSTLSNPDHAERVVVDTKKPAKKPDKKVKEAQKGDKK